MKRNRFGSATAWLALLAAVMLASMTIHAGPLPRITAESPLPWLHATISSDPGFALAVRAALGDVDPESIADVLPYSVVITNDSPNPLIGISFRFELKTGDTVITRDLAYNNFGSGMPPIFASGQSRVFTPLPGANVIASGKAGHGGHGGHQPKPMSPMAEKADQQVIDILSHQDAIHILVDFVISQDGRTAGGDKAQNIKQLTDQAQAHLDMTRELLGHLGAGRDKEAIAWLNTLAARKIVKHSGETMDRYAEMQTSVAAGWGQQVATRRDGLVRDLSVTATAVEKRLAFLHSLQGGLQ